MPTSTKTYIITPASGGAEYTIQAANYRYDETSGRHLFDDGTGDTPGLVANLINVSVHLQQD